MQQTSLDPGQGKFRRPAPGLSDPGERPAAHQRRFPADGGGLSQRRAGACLSDVANVMDGAENVKQAAWMNNTPAIIVNIQRQPGANIIQVVDRIQTLLPHSAEQAARRRKGVRADGSHDDDSRIGQGRRIRADADRRAGGDGDLSLPAEPCGDDYSERRRSALSGGHVRRDVPGGLQPEQPDVDGADDFDRLRGGRRDRDDREHRRGTSKRAKSRCRRRSRAPSRSVSRSCR